MQVGEGFAGLPFEQFEGLFDRQILLGSGLAEPVRAAPGRARVSIAGVADDRHQVRQRVVWVGRLYVHRVGRLPSVRTSSYRPE